VISERAATTRCLLLLLVAGSKAKRELSSGGTMGVAASLCQQVIDLICSSACCTIAGPCVSIGARALSREIVYLDVV
jgi:hypothetical protein